VIYVLFRLLLCCGTLPAVFVHSVTAQDSGVPIRISKETTYITSPLLSKRSESCHREKIPVASGMRQLPGTLRFLAAHAECEVPPCAPGQENETISCLAEEELSWMPRHKEEQKP